MKDDVDLAGGVPGRVLGMRSHRELFARRLRTTGALQALCRIATAGRIARPLEQAPSSTARTGTSITVRMLNLVRTAVISPPSNPCAFFAES